MMRRACPLVIAIAVVATPGSARAADFTIAIPGKYFDPARATAVAGDTVTWRNHDLVAHDVHVPGAAVDSGPLGRFAAFTYRFGRPGAYPYVCTLHPFMSGQLDVVAAALAAPPHALIAGEPLTLTGRAPAGTSYIGLQRSEGNGWQVVGPGATPAPDGTFALTTVAVTGASYRVSTPLGASPAVTPRVVARLHVRLRVGRRRNTVLRVTTMPAAPGLTATLERYARWHFRWRTARRARLDRDGHARFRLPARRRGYARVALRRTTHGHALAYSRTVRLRRGRPAHDPGLVGDHHDLDAVAHAELHQHARHVRLDGRAADDQLSGDLRVGQAARHELEHLELARRELVEAGRDVACARSRERCDLHHADLLVDDGAPSVAGGRPGSVTVAPGA
jgi:plastocyanin